MGNDMNNEVNMPINKDLGGGPRVNWTLFHQLHRDPAQLIYELLQNADDASADKVIFRLTEDRLDVHHNGKDFQHSDIRAIVDYGYSSKRRGKIGRFGVGFKSVYRVTSTPHIFSGEFNIKIVDREPEPMDALPVKEKELKTLIRLPFDSTDSTIEDAFQTVEGKLESLGARVLLFLRNVKKIEWTTPSSGGEYSKTSSTKELRSKKIPNLTAISNVKLKSPKGTHEYIVLKKPFEDTTFFVEAAFRLAKSKNGKKRIVAEKDTNLVVFFSTTEVTNLNFVIHGPYKTNLSRETVDLVYEKLNQRIVDETGELVADCLPAIKSRKDLKHFYVDLLNLLPTDSKKRKERSDGSIYSIFYDRVMEKLRSEKLIPTSEGGYVHFEDALMGSEAVRKLLSKADMGRLYPKKSWIDTGVSGELKTYLKDVIGVETTSFFGLATRVREYGTEEFMLKKTDKWVVAFYTELSEYKSLWKQNEDDPFLRYESIIRLSTKKHAAPFKLLNGEEKLQAYLPTKDMSSYNIVKSSLVNKVTRKFLKELGLTTPNIVTKVTESILPKYEEGNDTPDDEYPNDFRDILKAYENIPDAEKERLKNTRFVLAIENLTGKEILKSPNEVYFRTKTLEIFFEGYRHAYFVSKKLLRGDKGREMLGKLGAENKPRRIEIEDGLTPEKKRALRGYGECVREKIENYEYDGLNNFMSREISASKSYLLWKLLLEGVKDPRWVHRLPKEFFQGRYKKMPRWVWSPWRFFTSNFLKLLQDHEWLVDKNGDFRRPADILRSELPSRYYEKDSYYSSGLMDALEFKHYTPPPPDPIYQLQEDEQEKLKLLRKYPDMSASRIEEILSDASKSQNENQTPENETDENIPDTPIRRMKKPILKIRPASVPSIHPTPGPKPKPNQPRKEANSTDKKESGWKVEKRVFETLKSEEEFEVVWLNEDEERGIGCDFHVKRGDEIIKYIEVKSKTEEDPKEVIMTGAQWHLAWEQGNKYFLYVVSNIRSDEDAEGDIYQNPVKLWKERKLLIGNLSIKLPKNTQGD